MKNPARFCFGAQRSESVAVRRMPLCRWLNWA
jgi:hypothetical protein